MVYFESGKFKRYVKNIKDTSKNPKKEFREVQQLNITGLSKNSKFEDKQEVIIMAYEDFIKLQEDYNNKKVKLSELNKELETTKNYINELEGKLDKAPENINNAKIMSLYEKLENKNIIINNHKNIIIQANDKVNILIDEISHNITNYYNKEINENILSTQTRVINLLNQIKEINKTNLLLMQEIETQVNEYNKELNNTSRFTLFFKKNSFKIPIDFTELENKKLQLEEFNKLDIEDTAKKITKEFNINNDEILELKNNTKSKKIDFKELFKLDNNNSNDGENIIITDNYKPDEN